MNNTVQCIDRLEHSWLWRWLFMWKFATDMASSEGITSIILWISDYGPALGAVDLWHGLQIRGNKSKNGGVRFDVRSTPYSIWCLSSLLFEHKRSGLYWPAIRHRLTVPVMPRQQNPASPTPLLSLLISYFYWNQSWRRSPEIGSLFCSNLRGSSQ